MARKARRRPHNMGTVYQRGPGNFWMAFRIHGRRRYWRGYATFEEADRARAKLAADRAAGNVGLPVEGPPVQSLDTHFRGLVQTPRKDASVG